MSDLRIVVRGQPKPQGSKKPFVNKATGKPGLMESSGDALAWWRRAVTEAALAAIQADYERRLGEPVLTASRFPLEGPVELTALFTFRRPKSHYGTGRNSHVLKEDMPARPCGRAQGDLSHLIRAVEDSLTDAGAWGDDSQVSQYGAMTGKYWADDAPAILDVPGAVITIRPISPITNGATP